MKRNLLLLFFLFILTFLPACVIGSTAIAQPVLSWKKFRLAGYYNETNQEKGIADKILDFYMTHLPEYAHDVQEVPIVRIFSTMTEITEGGYLGPGKTKLAPQQLEQVLQSTVHLVMPPAGIVIRKEDAATVFNNGKEVSVRSLLNRSKHLVFCWISGATYHPDIRQAVEEYVKVHRDHPNVYYWSNIRKEIFDMLLQKRIDYFPNHAISFQYECSQRADCREKLMFIPVVEAQDDVLTYTFAAKTPVGQKVIATINELHQSKQYKAMLRELIAKHYPANMVDFYIDKNMELVGTAMQQ